MTSEKQPNIVFLVWDACRLDYAEEHAPNLRRLADERGTWFENAVAPGTWSLPSHASMFTGKYPHKHRMTQPSQSKMPATLIKRLKQEGYNCYGVTGNGFTSPRWGFDEEFDYLRFTQGPEPYGDGKEMYGYLRGKIEHENKSMPSALMDAVADCISHEKKLKSMANLMSVGVNHVSREVVPRLQKLPSPIFRAGPRYTYSGKKNTESIRQLLKQESKTDDPFFIFSNYMETHRPYIPNERLQQEHLGEVLSWDELVRLNEEVAEPWNFANLIEKNGVRKEDVQKIRSLYAGEVETVDQYLYVLLEELKSQDLLDDTLVIVTSDHGEMLGEEDAFSRRRMGHHAAMSESLSRVPLVALHPDIQQQNITEYVSLKNLFGLFLTSARKGTVDVDSLLSDNGVICESPALGDQKMYDKHPEISKETVAQRVSQDSVSVHSDGWHVVLDSDGNRITERNGKKLDINETPAELTEMGEICLNELSKIQKKDVDKETAKRLEDLGYM